MQLVLLLTDELKKTKPESVKITENYGPVHVRFDHHPSMVGDHCILEGTKDDVVNWLLPYDGVAVGKGSPMFQEFEIMHIGVQPVQTQRKEGVRALEL